LRQAQEAGVLRADEALTIQRAEHWRDAAIAVDSFADPYPVAQVPAPKQESKPGFMHRRNAA
jgi:hypothetical protein